LPQPPLDGRLHRCEGSFGDVPRFGHWP
jgi:hypothetical protein